MRGRGDEDAEGSKTSERAMEGSRGEVAMGSRGDGWEGIYLGREAEEETRTRMCRWSSLEGSPTGSSVHVHRFGGRWVSSGSLVEGRGGGMVVVVKGRW